MEEPRVIRPEQAAQKLQSTRCRLLEDRELLRLKVLTASLGRIGHDEAGGDKGKLGPLSPGLFTSPPNSTPLYPGKGFMVGGHVYCATK